MQNYRRFFPLIGAGILIASLALGGRLFPSVWFVYNYTDSLPKGFYRIERKTLYHRGDLLVFKVPEEVRRMVKDRHWLRDNGFLVKPLIGLRGDFVCTRFGRFKVAGHDFGGIEKSDKEGRNLPEYDACGVIQSGFLVGIEGMANSFDSRYYGPIQECSVLGIAVPLWLF
jgi:conjugative transfer signal peptidase TraF